MRSDERLRAGLVSGLTFLTALLLSGPAHGGESIGVEGPYLGQKPPRDTAVVFAPGIVSTGESELNAVFSPDGTELLFTRPLKGVRYRMMYMRMIDGKWTGPVEAPFAEGLNAVDPSYSPDGDTVFWCGTTAEGVGGDMDIWYSERTANGWTKAALAEPVISSEAEEVYPILTKSSTATLPLLHALRGEDQRKMRSLLDQHGIPRGSEREGTRALAPERPARRAGGGAS